MHPHLPDPTRTTTPELEYRAAEALTALSAPFGEHVREILTFGLSIRSQAREVLIEDVRRLPAFHPELVMRTAAVDSSHKTMTTAGMNIILCAAFRTSATNSEDHRFDWAPVDSGFDIEPIERLMRCQMETELLMFAHQGDDQITILDNSFLSLPASASQAQLALGRSDPGSLSHDTLRKWCDSYLGVEGSLATMLCNVRVIALPKVGTAQSLVAEVYDRIDVSAAQRGRPGARAQHDRLLLRSVLRPGEYLAPRPLVAGGTADRHWRRFFADFPGRDRVQHIFDASDDDPERGIDVVYLRPRRATGAAEGPVMRVEVHRALARNDNALHQILLTLEDSLDGEHPEPVPQLLADHYAKGAVRHAPAAIAEIVYADLLDEHDDPEVIDLLTSLFQEQRS
ncbi:MAG: hypothetical protein LC713_05600 [Actinobacteria bacterium]|nr:hypothetical protein [Actinomycetota bacterium]